MKFPRFFAAVSGAILLASATLTHAATGLVVAVGISTKGDVGLMDNYDPPDSSSNRFNESLTGFC